MNMLGILLLGIVVFLLDVYWSRKEIREGQTGHRTEMSATP